MRVSHSRFRYHNFFFVPLVILAACMQGGCATSVVRQELWQPESYFPHLVGTAHDDPRDPKRTTSLVLRYMAVVGTNGKEHDYFVSVPLSDGGTASPPLAYSGGSLTVDEISQELSEAQKSAVTKFVFDDTAYRNAKSAMSSPRYTAIPQPEAFGAATGGTIGEDIAVFGYRQDGMAVGEAGPDTSHVVRFPPGSRALLVPYKQPRPKNEMARARAVATVLTPFALAFDVITFPAQLLYRMTHC